MNFKLYIGLFLALGLAACTEPLGDTTGNLNGDDDVADGSGNNANDKDDRDDTGGSDNPDGSGEQCNNFVDDDVDGLVDEGCPCTPGETRPCFSGPADRADVGTCASGAMTCVANGEFSSWDGVCDGEILPAEDDVPSNGLDDDCDGTVDTDGGGGGGGGGPDTCIPTYSDREFDLGFGGSRIDPGDGQPIMEESCELIDCPDGQVAVDLDACETPDGTSTDLEDLLRGGTDCTDREILCVDAPPTCAPGEFPTYRPDAGWTCDPPCEVIVTYGGIYGFERHCASKPDLSCGFGEVPTFALETEVWECRPTCDNGLYDQHYLDGELVCIPC